MMASTLATSRPSEKLGTHSTRDIEGNRSQGIGHREKVRLWILGSKRFFVYNVRHFGDVSAMVLLQHIDQSLHAAAGHSQFRIRRQTSLHSSAGEVMKQPASVFNLRIAER